MKSTLMKAMLALGIAAGITAVSSQAQACGSCHSTCNHLVHHQFSYLHLPVQASNLCLYRLWLSSL